MGIAPLPGSGGGLSNPESMTNQVFDDSGSTTLRAESAIIVEHTTPTTDIPAPGTFITGATATTFATGTTANKRGGAIVLEAGRGKVAGTDPAGPIYVGLGDEVAGVLDIANGMVFGTGAAVGTPGAANYVPFTVEKGKLNVRYDRLCFNLGMLAAASSAEPLYVYSENLNQYVAVGNTGVSMVVNGTTVLNAATVGTLTLATPGTAQLQSTGGAAHLIAQSSNVCSMNGGNIECRSGNRTVKFQNYNASEDALTLAYPASTTLSADGLTTLATLSPPTGAVWFVRGSIRAWDSSTNAWTSDFRFGLKNVAGTVTTFNVTKTEAGSGGSMASMASDLPGAGATALIRASRPAGVSVTVKCHYWIEA